MSAPTDDSGATREAGPSGPLSDDEEAMLRAALDGDASLAPSTPVDLASGDGAVRDALRALPRSERRAEDLLRRAVTTIAGCKAHVVTEGAELTTGRAAMKALPPGFAAVTLTCDGSNVGFLALGPRLVAFLLDRRLGTPVSTMPSENASTAPAPEPRVRLTALDQRLLRPVLRSIATTLADAFSEQLRPCGLGAFLGSAAELTDAVERLAVLRATLHVTLPHQPVDSVSFVVGGSAIRAKPRDGVSTKPKSPTPNPWLVESLSATRVEVSARLGGAATTLDRLRAMRVGDIVLLDTSEGDALGLYVEGVQKGAGTPAMKRGRVALELRSAVMRAGMGGRTSSEEANR